MGENWVCIAGVSAIYLELFQEGISLCEAVVSRDDVPSGCRAILVGDMVGFSTSFRSSAKIFDTAASLAGVKFSTTNTVQGGKKNTNLDRSRTPWGIASCHSETLRPV